MWDTSFGATVMVACFMVMVVNLDAGRSVAYPFVVIHELVSVTLVSSFLRILSDWYFGVLIAPVSLFILFLLGGVLGGLLFDLFFYSAFGFMLAYWLYPYSSYIFETPLGYVVMGLPIILVMVEFAGLSFSIVKGWVSRLALVVLAWAAIENAWGREKC